MGWDRVIVILIWIFFALMRLVGFRRRGQRPTIGDIFTDWDGADIQRSRPLDPYQQYVEDLYDENVVTGRYRRQTAAHQLGQLALKGHKEAVRVLAIALDQHTDPQVHRIANETLRSLQDSDTIDVACSVWVRHRIKALETIIRDRGWVAQEPEEALVATALLNRKLSRLTYSVPKQVEYLLLACNDPHREISSEASHFVANPPTEAWKEAICLSLIHHSNPVALEIVKEAGYTPAVAAQRALFYFLTGQLDRYETLDFDRSMLRTIYDTADTELRQRIASIIRSSGRPEWTDILKVRTHARKDHRLTEQEWETVVRVLHASHRYDELWTLMFDAPPWWAAEILYLLKRDNYRPSVEADYLLYAELCALDTGTLETARVRYERPMRASFPSDGRIVQSIALMPDGESLLLGGARRTQEYGLIGELYLWNIEGTNIAQILYDCPGKITAVACSADGQWLAAGTEKGTIHLTQTGAKSAVLELTAHTDSLNCLAFAPHVPILASTGMDASVCLWHITEGGSVPRRMTGSSMPIWCLAFSPDGLFLAGGGSKKSLFVWDWQSGEVIREFSGHEAPIWKVAFSPGVKEVMTSSGDGTIRVWDIATGEETTRFSVDKVALTSLAVSRDGNLLAGGGIDGKVRIWDRHSGMLHCELQVAKGAVRDLLFTPDGRGLIARAEERDEAVDVWEIIPVRALAQMTADDLKQIERLASGTTPHADNWRFVERLLRYRLRYDIQIAEAVERVYGEFDIEIECQAVDA